MTELLPHTGKATTDLVTASETRLHWTSELSALKLVPVISPDQAQRLASPSRGDLTHDQLIPLDIIIQNDHPKIKFGPCPYLSPQEPPQRGISFPALRQLRSRMEGE